MKRDITGYCPFLNDDATITAKYAPFLNRTTGFNEPVFDDIECKNKFICKYYKLKCPIYMSAGQNK